MFLRESPTSLQVYFGIAGILFFLSFGRLLIFAGPLGLSDAFSKILLIALPLSGVLSILSFALSIGWSIGCLYFAIRLRNYLNPLNVKYINIFLLFSLVVITILWAVIEFLILVEGQVNPLTPIIAALIIGYLYVNVNRLAHLPFSR